MATRKVEISQSAVDIADGLTSGAMYLVEVMPKGGPAVFLAEADNLDTVPEAYHTILQGHRIGITIGTSPIYVWSSGEATLAITEV